MNKLFLKLFLLLAIFSITQAKIEEPILLLTLSVICLAKTCQEVAQEQMIKNKLKQQELAAFKKNLAHLGDIREDLFEICSKKPEFQAECTTIFQNILKASELDIFCQEDLAILRKLKDNNYRDVPQIAYAALRETGVPTEALYRLSDKQKQEIRKLLIS